MNRNYRTNNIDIFATSDDSDSEDYGYGHSYGYNSYGHHQAPRHYGGYGNGYNNYGYNNYGYNNYGYNNYHQKPHYEEPVKQHYKPEPFISDEHIISRTLIDKTPVESESDYDCSDYGECDVTVVDTESSVEEVVYNEPRCATANMDWNVYGYEGTIDFYQPSHGPMLIDGDFDGLHTYKKHEVAIRRRNIGLLTCGWIAEQNAEFEKHLGRIIDQIGELTPNFRGDASIREFNDDLRMDDIINNSVVIRDNVEDFELSQFRRMGCGIIQEVECPREMYQH